MHHEESEAAAPKGLGLEQQGNRMSLLEHMIDKRVKNLEYLKKVIEGQNEILWMNTIKLRNNEVSEHLSESKAIGERLTQWFCMGLSLSGILHHPNGSVFVSVLCRLLDEWEHCFSTGVERIFKELRGKKVSIPTEDPSPLSGGESPVAFLHKISGSHVYELLTVPEIPIQLHYKEVILCLSTILMFVYRKFLDSDCTEQSGCMVRIISLDKKFKHHFFGLISRELEKVAEGAMRRAQQSIFGLFSNIDPMGARSDPPEEIFTPTGFAQGDSSESEDEGVRQNMPPKVRKSLSLLLNEGDRREICWEMTTATLEEFVNWVTDTPGATDMKFEGKSLLHLAAKSGNMNITRYIVEELEADVNVTDGGGSTPMHAAAWFSRPLIIEYLLERQADTTVINSNNETALQNAIESLDPDRTPLTVIFSMKRGSISCVEKCLENRRKYYKRTENPQTIKELINQPMYPNCGSTFLHAAASSGNLCMVDHLIKQGGDITKLDSKSSNILHLAAASGNYKLLRHLMKIACEQSKTELISAIDDSDCSPLSYAIISFGSEIEEEELIFKQLSQYYINNANELIEILSEFEAGDVMSPLKLNNSTGHLNLSRPSYNPEILEELYNCSEISKTDIVQHFSRNSEGTMFDWLNENISPFRSMGFTKSDFSTINKSIKSRAKSIIESLMRFKHSLSDSSSPLKEDSYWIYTLIGSIPIDAADMIVACCLYTTEVSYRTSRIKETLRDTDHTDLVNGSIKETVRFNMLKPMMFWLHVLLERLPKQKLYTDVRGDANLRSEHFQVGRPFIFKHFMSGSKMFDVAATACMDPGGGVLIFKVSSSGASVTQFSVYKEYEVLFRPNSIFKVVWKLSSSLLRMCDRSQDVVVMIEVPTGRLPEKVVLQVIRNANRFVFGENSVFQNFFKKYVEATLCVDLCDDPQEDIKFYELLHRWTKSSKESPTHLAILGGGGSGKTSLSLKTVSQLLTTADETFPIFVPLARVTNSRGICAALTNNAIDDYIKKYTLGIDCGKDRIKYLLNNYKVIVVLESLDEISCDITNTVTVNQLIEANPSILGSPGVQILITCRLEYLTRNGLTINNFISDVDVYQMRPFSEADKNDYIVRCESNDLRSILLEKGLWGSIRNPFQLYMATSSITELRKLDAQVRFTSNDIFKSYLKWWIIKEGHPLSAIKNRVNKLISTQLAFAEELACRMLASNTWEGLLSRFFSKEEMKQDGFSEKLSRIPLRLEDAHQGRGMVTFRHKAIAEYLISKKLFDSPVQTLTIRLKGVNLNIVPNALQLYRLHVQCSPSKRSTLLEELRPLIKGESRNVLWQRQLDDNTITATSNVLSMLAAAGVPVCDVSVSGLHVRDADLSNIVFSGCNLKKAVFTNCSLRGAQFIDTNIESVTFQNTDFGMLLPPIHTGSPVLTVTVFTNKKSYIASGCMDGTLRIHSSKSGELVFKFVFDDVFVHRNAANTKNWVTSVTSVLFKNKVSVAACCRDVVVLVTEHQGDWRQMVLENSDRWMCTLCFIENPTHCHLVGGDSSGGLTFWCGDGVDNSIQKHLSEAHTLGEIEALTSIESLLASGSSCNASNNIKIWSVVMKGSDIIINKVSSINQCFPGLSNIAFTGRGSSLTTNCNSGIRVWDLNKLEITEEFRSWCDAMSYSPSSTGNQFLAHSDESTINILNVFTRKSIKTLVGHRDKVRCLAYCSTGRTLVSGSDDKEIRVWNARETIQSDVIHDISRENVLKSTSIDVSIAVNHIAVGSLTGVIRIWHLITGSHVCYAGPLSQRISKLLYFSRTDGEYLLSVSRDQITIFVMCGSEYNQVGKIKNKSSQSHLSSVAVTSCGCYIMAVSDTSDISVWKCDDITNPILINTTSIDDSLTLSRSGCLAYSNDGFISFGCETQIVTLSCNPLIESYFKKDSVSVTTTPVRELYFISKTISKPTLLITSGSDGVRCWTVCWSGPGKVVDVVPYSLHLNIEYPSKSISVVNNSELATSVGNKIIINSLYSKTPPIPLLGHCSEVNLMASSGSYLVSSSADNRIRIWEVLKGKWTIKGVVPTTSGLCVRNCKTTGVSDERASQILKSAE